MKTYTLVMNTITGALSWSYKFEASSDHMARDAASRCLKFDPAAKTAVTVALFSDDRCLVEFEIVNETKLKPIRE